MSNLLGRLGRGTCLHMCVSPTTSSEIFRNSSVCYLFIFMTHSAQSLSGALGDAPAAKSMDLEETIWIKPRVVCPLRTSL